MPCIDACITNESSAPRRSSIPAQRIQTNAPFNATMAPKGRHLGEMRSAELCGRSLVRWARPNCPIKPARTPATKDLQQHLPSYV